MKINKFFTIVFITVITVAFYACTPIVDPGPENSEPGMIHVTVNIDGNPLINGIPLEDKDKDIYIHLDRADPDMPGLLIILENPWLYDEGSIVWRLSGSIVGNGNECFIDAFEFKNLGLYYVSVSVRINGVPFNRTFTVIVFNSDEEEEDNEE